MTGSQCVQVFLTTRGGRVMASVSQFIVVKLKLKVNREKSAVARPWDRKFLGFSFTRDRNRNGALPGRSLSSLSKESGS